MFLNEEPYYLGYRLGRLIFGNSHTAQRPDPRMRPTQNGCLRFQVWTGYPTTTAGAAPVAAGIVLPGPLPHMFVCTYTYTCINGYVNEYVHVYIYIYIHTHTHVKSQGACIHIYIYRHVYMYVHL